MTSPIGRRRLWFHRGLRVAVSALVLAAIFSVLPMQAVFSTIRRTDASRWIATLLIFIAGHIVSAAKWRLLVGEEAGFGAVLRAHFAGLAANLWLPGLASGDLVRAAVLHRRVADKTRLAVGSVADRLVDTVGLLLAAAAGLAFTFRSVPWGGRWLLGIAAAFAVLFFSAIAAPRFFPALLSRLSPDSRGRRLGEGISSGVVLLARRPVRLVMCLTLSMVVQAAFVFANVILAEGAGVNAPLAAWFFAWPLSKIIAMLPISLGGIGVREASLAGFLAPFGASPTAVVATGLLWQTILLAGGAVGLAATVLLSGGPSQRRNENEAEGPQRVTTI